MNRYSPPTARFQQGLSPLRSCFRSYLLYCALLTPWVTACERATDEPAVSASLPSTPELPAQNIQERCIIPLAEPPAPQAAPAPQCPNDPQASTASLAEALVYFEDAPDAPPVTVELAKSASARTRGLMYRSQMSENAGMLFSWDNEKPRSFWMRNTCLPLDMLFIALDGTIVSILEQVPTLNLLPRPSVCPAAHVLEVNAGWVRRHGVQPGQRIRLPQ